MRQLRNPHSARWDFLEGTIGNGVNPTDIDLAYERHGKFLFLEGKHSGVEVPKGQAIFYDRLSKLPGVTIILFDGTPPEDITAFGMWGHPKFPGTADDLRETIREWWGWATQFERAA